MENQLIQIYLFVCQIDDTCSDTCFQRMSNNNEPLFTDQELITIWLFAHLNGFAQKKQMHRFITNYWHDWFPRLPAYQTFVYRLNLLEASFQTLGKVLLSALQGEPQPEIDCIVDSFPVMLAQQGHSYSARVAREIADAGFCAAKKTRFHGIRLHVIAVRCQGKLPKPVSIWLREASAHDSRAFEQQSPELPETTLFGDLALSNPSKHRSVKRAEYKTYCPKEKTQRQRTF